MLDFSRPCKNNYIKKTSEIGFKISIEMKKSLMNMNKIQKALFDSSGFVLATLHTA